MGGDYHVACASRLEGSDRAVALIITARAAADSALMASAGDVSIDAAAQKYCLTARTFFLESFGMMEEGRGNGGRASRY